MKAQDYSETRELLQLILAGDLKMMEIIYDRYEERFVSNEVKYGRYRFSDAVEAYQRAIIIVFEKIQKKEISVLTSSLETYIFSIAKHQLQNIDKENNSLLIFDDQLKYDSLTDYTSSPDKVNLIKKYIQKLLKTLTHQDRRIIWYYYFKKYDWKTIASKMNLDEGYLRKRKCEILSKLKKYGCSII